MRKSSRSTVAASLAAALLMGLAILPARADDAQTAGKAIQPGTAIDAEATARNLAACGFQVEVHFTDGRTESARWEMAPGNSPTATAFCRSRAAGEAALDAPEIPQVRADLGAAIR